MKTFFTQYPALVSFLALGIIALIAGIARRKPTPVIASNEEPEPNDNSAERIVAGWMRSPVMTTIGGDEGGSGANGAGMSGGRFSSGKS